MISTVTNLPFNELVGLQQGGETSLLTLPAGGQYLNHLGTVHAGALLTLAEAATGEFLLKHLGPIEGVVPVVRRIEAKFRKPAHGAITSSTSISEGALNDVKRELAVKARALFSIPVDLHDAAGTHVLSASVEWFIATKP